MRTGVQGGREHTLHVGYFWPKGRRGWIKDNHEFFVSPLIKKQSRFPLSLNLGCSVTCFDQHNAAESQSPCVGSDYPAGWSDRPWRMRDTTGGEKPNQPPAPPVPLCGARRADNNTPGPVALADETQPAPCGAEMSCPHPTLPGGRIMNTRRAAVVLRH